MKLSFYQEFYQKSIDEKKKKNIYRSLSKFTPISSTKIKKDDNELISFCSNDYFALAQNDEVKKAAIDAINKFGVGASSSRFISGNNHLYEELEESLARFKNCDDAIVFSSGYNCAISIIPALVGKGDLVIADRLIHSCLIDGIKLSQAKLFRFAHNDLNHCCNLLKENRNQYKKCLIISESIFSMDGDIADIDALLELSKKFNSLLLIDYAHDLGLNKIDDKNCDFLKMGTLSKAFGSFGGYIAGDSILIDYLRNFAKSVIYSTALPPAILQAAITSMQIIKQGNLGQKALDNASYFCQLLDLNNPQSAIVPIIIGDSLETLKIAQNIAKEGFLVSAIRPPTVENGKSRLRITFSAMHNKEQIKQLSKIIMSNLLTSKCR